MTKPVQVQFAVPANLDELDLCEARVHIGFLSKSYKNSWRFQYADGTIRHMNKGKWVLHSSLIGARASLRALLERKHELAVQHVQHIEYLMGGDML